MTPSGWHDEACRTRDAGHDEMQIGVWRVLLNRADEERKRLEAEPQTHLTRWPRVSIEYPIIKRGAGVIAFADLAVIWVDDQKDARRAVLYEIKPKIHAACAVLRQAVSLSRAFALGHPHCERCEVGAIVPFDDPKLPLLSELMECLTWNQATSELKEYLRGER